MKSIDFENRRKGQKLLPSSLSSAKKDKEDIYIFENGEDKLRNAESGKGIEDECEGNRRNKEIIEIMSLDQAGKSNIVPPSKQGNGAEIHFKWEKGRQAWLNVIFLSNIIYIYIYRRKRIKGKD